MSGPSSKPRRIKRVECFRKIKLATDSEKITRGITNKCGEPTPPKRLLPDDHIYSLSFLELYKTQHDCDICCSPRKSSRVAIIQDKTTGEEFSAAPDCLYYQFGEHFNDLLKDSSQTRDLFNRMADELDVEAGSDLEVIKRVAENFEQLLSFPTDAAEEARQIVRILHEDQSARFSKELRHRIYLLTIFLNFQIEHRDRPGFFEARWFALKHHPLRSKLNSYRDTVERVMNLESRTTLTLTNFGELLKALETVRGKQPKLRNDVLNPADYPDEKSYVEELRRYYVRRADDIRDVNDLDRVEFWRSQYVQTMYGSIPKFPLMLGVYNDWPVKTPIENFRLENTRALSQESQGRAEYYIASEILGGSHKTKNRRGSETVRTFVRTVAFWVPDVWTPTYLKWKLFSRDALEAEPRYL